jgi:membrane-associated protease RseP (regulator of RpoE activity)
MSENPLPQFEYQVYDPERQEIRVMVVHPPRRRYWVHVLLFAATIFTTLCVGARLQDNFLHNAAPFSNDLDLWPWSWIFEDWHRLVMGIPFCACLLGILTAHEFGHYFFCVRRGVYATLPFFIPAPTLIGTMGAFIRIRSPIRSRADLFDIGIAGPIAGFLVAMPVLIFALLHSKTLAPGIDAQGLPLGFPLIFKLTHWFLAAAGSPTLARLTIPQLCLHPTAMAAWVGMFATSLNLLPGGQLDGGHIIFALAPGLHRRVSMLAILVLLPMAWFLWAGWLLWALVLRLTGSRHPDVPLYPPLDRKRWVLGAFALLMLILTLTPTPFPGDGDNPADLSRILQKFRKERMQHSPSQQR